LVNKYPDLSRPEAEEEYDEWQRLGEPDADGHRTRPIPQPGPDPNDPDNNRVRTDLCPQGQCPEKLVPVVVAIVAGVAYVVWKSVKTCACTAVGTPALGGICLVTPP